MTGLQGEPGGPCRLGVLAFGDSITNGGGELQWGVALQSWALWTARGLGLPYSPYAVDGACAADVTGSQMRAFQATTANPGARYQLGCVYVGTNDVRDPDWDPEAFEGHLDETLQFLRERCDRLLTATVRVSLGRPRTPVATVEAANGAIERTAARAGALVLDLRSFGARNLMMVDDVHPTAFGQIAIAELALAVLERDGMTLRVHPSQLISYSVGWRARLRGDVTYAWRQAMVGARAAARRGACAATRTTIGSLTR